MEARNASLYELLKYPVITLSVVLGLVLAKWLLGFNLGMIEEIGAGGIKFRESQKATAEALAQLELRINELEARLVAAEPQEGEKPLTKETSARPFVATSKTAESSDYVARLVRQSTKSGLTILRGQIGFIWIGNYDTATGKWDQPKLIQLDSGRPVQEPPEVLAPGSTFRVGGNLVMRGGLPKNDAAYFRAQPVLGVIPRGTIVELLQTPVGIDREFAVQYWAKIRVAE